MKSVLNRFETYLLTEKRVSENTLIAYKNDINQLVMFLKDQFCIGLKEATKVQLKSFLYYIKKQGATSRTMSRKISSIKALFNYLNTYFDWVNISDDLTFPRLEKRLPQYLTEEEVVKLFEVAKKEVSDIGIRNKVMLSLLYVSGMRISEMVNLHISQIQFDTGFITINGKGGRGRVVPIPESVIELLKNYIKNTLVKLAGKDIKRCKDDFLFPIIYAGKIKPISRQSFWIILKELWKKAGGTRAVSPHQLRHSLATHMLKNGIDLRSLQMILGHENLSTVQIYTHLDVSYLRSVYDKKHPRA